MLIEVKNSKRTDKMFVILLSEVILPDFFRFQQKHTFIFDIHIKMFPLNDRLIL